MRTDYKEDILHRGVTSKNLQRFVTILSNIWCSSGIWFEVTILSNILCSSGIWFEIFFSLNVKNGVAILLIFVTIGIELFRNLKAAESVFSDYRM